MKATPTGICLLLSVLPWQLKTSRCMK